jgi:hypothetical protein
VKGDSETVRNGALTGLLILQAFILFVAAPIAALGIQAPLFGGAILIAGVMATIILISPGAGAKSLAAGAIALAIAGNTLRIERPAPINLWLGHGAVILAVLAISIVIGRVVFAPGRVTYHRIEGAITLYLNIAIVFTAAYRLVAEISPGAFTNLPHDQNEVGAASFMLYFSFTTLTSTGFGDILPLHPVARSLANLEAVLGQLYLTVLLARLVSLHIEAHRD